LRQILNLIQVLVTVKYIFGKKSQHDKLEKKLLFKYLAQNRTEIKNFTYIRNKVLNFKKVTVSELFQYFYRFLIKIFLMKI
jgi:exo-beta-1,3-glucanase (GH17 family)